MGVTAAGARVSSTSHFPTALLLPRSPPWSIPTSKSRLGPRTSEVGWTPPLPELLPTVAKACSCRYLASHLATPSRYRLQHPPILRPRPASKPRSQPNFPPPHLCP